MIVLDDTGLDLLEPVVISRGERFCQGVFLPYGTAEEEENGFEVRTGGLGSTGQ